MSMHPWPLPALVAGMCLSSTACIEIEDADDGEAGVVVELDATTDVDDAAAREQMEEIDTVLVGIDRVELRHETLGWLPLTESTGAFDLVDTGSLPHAIAQGVVAEGFYDAVRLRFSDLSYIQMDEDIATLSLPQEVTVGDRFCVDDFDDFGGETVEDLEDELARNRLRLSWNLAESLRIDRAAGDFVLRPTGLAVIAEPVCDED